MEAECSLDVTDGVNIAESFGVATDYGHCDLVCHFIFSEKKLKNMLTRRWNGRL
jgi:hypothetical protein